MKKDKEKISKRTGFDLVISVLSIVLTVATVLTTLTYSWIRRNWSNTVYEESIKIEANGALAFILDGETTATNAISILDQLGYNNFVFKPVSNATGESEDFFTLNKENQTEHYQHLMQSPPVTPTGWQTQGQSYGYIEFRFLIIGESVVQKEEGQSGSESSDYMKYVYLKDNSFFSAYEDTGSYDPSIPLRISISVNDSPAVIIKKPVEDDMTHTGINNVRTTSIGDNDTAIYKQAWYADGVSYWNEDRTAPVSEFTYGNTTYPIAVSTTARKLSDFDGGFKEDESGKHYVNANKCVCSFPSNGQVWLTVRIWLEGTDPTCDDSIAGQRLKLFLNFEAVNCRMSTDSQGYAEIIEREPAQKS